MNLYKVFITGVGTYVYIQASSLQEALKKLEMTEMCKTPTRLKSIEFIGELMNV